MNNRESSSKASKNQFRGVVEERVAKAKKKAEPEPLTAEELAAAEAKAAQKAAQKAAGFAEFQRKKAERKRLRAKHHAE
jgi:lipoate-protein ligase A